jgi:type VI secretion system secreted protein Hcp
MATADILLELEGIEGESGDDAHPNTIELTKCTGGVVNSTTAGTGGGSGQGKVIFHALSCTGPMSKAYPLLVQYCADGSVIPKATLYTRKQGGGSQQEYLTHTYEHVLVKSVHKVIDSGGARIMFQLSYQTIVQEYKPQQDDQTLGSAVKTGWNLKKNVKHG